ncbi:MAG: UDP-N-acetylmuramate dehydrogenase [Oscillospiraceae bacterium]|nr:UDP-N-acetylmuramate dehydrogenase [Oscillospiraceae bacterium]
MCKYTSLKAGGNASLLITPNSIPSLREIVVACKENEIEYFILGNGSNVLVRDGGIDGAVIRLGSDLSKITLLDENTIFAEAGASLKSICMFALEHSLSGLEFAYGIPGTLGGAVYMNAGAYGGEMKDVLYSVSHIDENGEFGELSKENLNLSYRHSAYAENGFVITSAVIKLQNGNYDDIKAKMNELLSKRKEKQPIEYPSAGSTFKRPEGYFAGALIEDCNLKGKEIGGAQVSEKHAGFIINKNKATASDILNLIEFVQDEVYKKHGVHLETEVKIIGK